MNQNPVNNNPVNCILNNLEQEELLLGYCAATLDAETSRTYTRHLTTCEHCRDLVQMQKLVDETLAEWQAPELSHEFDRKLFARIRAEQASPKPWWQEIFSSQIFFNTWGWKPALGIALALFSLALFISRSPDTTDLAHQSDAIQANEIEQVELALDDIEALQTLQPSENKPAPDPASAAVKKESL